MKLTETQVADFNSGKRDKKAGVYDKWYRYNRRDDGAAYDDGFNAAPFIVPVHIIEVAESRM